MKIQNPFFLIHAVYLHLATWASWQAEYRTDGKVKAPELTVALMMFGLVVVSIGVAQVSVIAGLAMGLSVLLPVLVYRPIKRDYEHFTNMGMQNRLQSQWIAVVSMNLFMFVVALFCCFAFDIGPEGPLIGVGIYLYIVPAMYVTMTNRMPPGYGPRRMKFA